MPSATQSECRYSDTPLYELHPQHWKNRYSADDVATSTNRNSHAPRMTSPALCAVLAGRSAFHECPSPPLVHAPGSFVRWCLAVVDKLAIALGTPPVGTSEDAMAQPMPDEKLASVLVCELEATLRADRPHTADLEHDLVDLIELKLALAEARNELAERRGSIR